MSLPVVPHGSESILFLVSDDKQGRKETTHRYPTRVIWVISTANNQCMQQCFSFHGPVVLMQYGTGSYSDVPFSLSGPGKFSLRIISFFARGDLQSFLGG